MPDAQFYDAVTENIRVQTSTVKTFTFDMGKPIEFQAGQFVMAHVPREGQIAKKPYSIASPPYLQNKIQLCIKKVEGGFMSNHFHQLKVGDPMKLQGPLGKFLIQEPIQKDLAFVATGTGIAPLRSMIFDLYHRKKVDHIKCWCFLGVRYEDEILFSNEFRKLEQEHPNFEFVPTVSRPKNWSGEVGYVQEKVKKYLTHPKEVDIYACGLVNMIEETLKVLGAAGFPPEQMHYEKWT